METILSKNQPNGKYFLMQLNVWKFIFPYKKIFLPSYIMEINISSLEIMPLAPGKSPVTFNMPTTLKRRVGVEAEKRGMRKVDLIAQVLVKHLDDYLLLLDASETPDKDSHGC